MKGILNRTQQPGSIWGLDSLPSKFNLRGQGDYDSSAQDNYENLLRIHQQVQNFQKSQSKIKSLLHDRTVKKSKFLSKTEVGKKLPDSKIITKPSSHNVDFERDVEFSRSKSRGKSRGSKGSRGGSRKRARRVKERADSVEEAR
mmetsp:Transcript_11137/g.16918  ORF Transcript_11137/g.16918 Transcript_11137/m.16918 type:complete len:144 (+) Transcript_11137:1086-1517(+)